MSGKKRKPEDEECTPGGSFLTVMDGNLLS